MDTVFNYGKYAVGEIFTDRDAEQQRLAGNFLHGINTIISSPRRWGKSSLVLKVAENIVKKHKNYRFCFIDLFNTRSEKEFYELFAKEVIKASSTQWEDRMHTAKNIFKSIIPKISFSPGKDTEFSLKFEWEDIQKHRNEILNLPEEIAKTKKLNIIVCIDEFQNITFFNDPLAVQKTLRSQWQKHQHCTYCLYGSRRSMINHIFSSPDMPFYKFGDMMFMKKIEEKYWVPFIISRFKKGKKIITGNIAQQIAATMENHPYFVQQYAQMVWLHTTNTANKTNLQTALESLLDQHAIIYQRETDLLSNHQLNLLRAYADDVAQPGTNENIKKYELVSSAHIAKSKAALENKEITDAFEKTVFIIDPLFKIWLRKRYFANK